MPIMGRCRTVALCAAALAACARPGAATAGHVLDYLTGAPVPAALVTLRCDRPRLLHGSETIRTLVHETAPDGSYTFAQEELAGCPLKDVRADKPGFRYLPLLQGNACDNVGATQVPATLCLVEASALGAAAVKYHGDQMQALLPRLVEAHAARSRADQGDPSRLRGQLAAYLQVFQSFVRSAALASGAAERSQVAARHCPALRAMFDDLTPQERRFATQLEESGRDGMGFPAVPDFRYDFELHAAPVCGH